MLGHGRTACGIFSLIVLLVLQTHSQDVLTFSPDRYPCVGDRIEMLCYIEPPANETFACSVALVSFNSSSPASAIQINANDTVGGVDLSRYSANVDGLDLSTNRPAIRLVIDSYLPSDSDTLFGYHGAFPLSIPAARVSGMPLRAAALPSSPVSLTADNNSPTCSGTVQLAWTPGASDRDIEMYFLSLNGVLIASLGPVTSYMYTANLQRDTEYTYSVVAMSCAGNSTETLAPSISVGNPPSSPVLTLSQTDTSCSNLLISWSTPSSDRPILTYSVYRDDTFLTDTTDNQYTDNTQLSLSTVYEYSVVAISCAGISTAGVVVVKLEYNLTSFSVSYDTTNGKTLLSWVLSTDTSLRPVNSMKYFIEFTYTHTQGDDTESSPILTDTFLQLSTDTSYDLSDHIDPPSFPGVGKIVTEISVCIYLTEQCGRTISGVTECAKITAESSFPVTPIEATTTATTTPRPRPRPNSATTLQLSTVIVLLWVCVVYAMVHWL